MATPGDFPMHTVTHITHPCPNCGYCPTCGRSNHVNPFLPWDHPFRPVIATGGTTSNIPPNTITVTY